MIYRYRILISLVFLCCFLTPRLNAQDAVLVVLSNNTSQAASDLHLVLNGGGGNLFADPLAVYAPGCPTPNVPSNPPATSNQVDIDWGVPCVAPGKFVAVLVSTMNGPLTFSSGYWTLNGVPIGNINPNDISIQSITLPPGAIYGGSMGGGTGGTTITFHARYRPCGGGLYTPWFGGVATCWYRLCCFPAGFQCEFRMTVCTTTPMGGFFGTQTCVSTTGWVPAGKTGPIWFWQRLTYPPPIICNHVNPFQLFGPSPDMPKQPVESTRPWWDSEEVVFKDEKTGHSRRAANLTTTFLEMGEVLSRRIETLEAPETFEEIITYLGPKYVAASDSLSPLIREADFVLGSDLSDAERDTMRYTKRVLVGLQSSMAHVGRELSTGLFSDARPLRNLNRSLHALADTLDGLRSARLANAAENIRCMAAGIEHSADMVETGMSTTAEQDYFLWGLMNRFQPMLPQVGMAAAPHVRVNLDLGDHQWFPSDVSNGTVFKIQDARSRRIVEEGVLPISDLFSFDLPISVETKRAYVLYKLPTHLSKVLRVKLVDGKVIDGGEPVAGDVNGDDCIDEADLEEVIADFGQGGRFADRVPPSDVNFDGIVDDVDFSIVRSNFGKCGDKLPATMDK